MEGTFNLHDAIEKLYAQTVRKEAKTTAAAASVTEETSLIDALRRQRNEAMWRQWMAQHSVERRVRKHHVETFTAEEMRERIVNKYIQKLMNLIVENWESRQLTMDIQSRDADLMPRVERIMATLGYAFDFDETCDLISVSW